MLKEQKGITLVALIITIIVMLILAGVSISLVVGDNGVLTQAQDVNPKQLVASAKEAVALANGDIMSTYYSDTTTPASGTTKSTSPKTLAEVVEKINANYSGTDLVKALKDNKGQDVTNPDFESEAAMPDGDTTKSVNIILSVPGAQLSGDEYKDNETITITVKCEKKDGLYSLTVN